MLFRNLTKEEKTLLQPGKYGSNDELSIADLQFIAQGQTPNAAAAADELRGDKSKGRGIVVEDEDFPHMPPLFNH